MKSLVFIALAAACSPRLTDDAVLLVEPHLLDVARAAEREFRPHVGVKVTVTDDYEVFDAWPTEERWRQITTNGGEWIDGAVLCTRGQTSTGTMGVTERGAKTIWIGPCVVQDAQLAVVFSHEFGHFVGAEDCDDGVMRGWDPSTVKTSAHTQQELKALYE